MKEGDKKVTQAPLLTRRVICFAVLFAIIVAIAGWRGAGDFVWVPASLFGMIISLINFWLLTLLVLALLTEGGGFNYKTLALLMAKFVILFGGLGAGLVLFKLPLWPLLLGFMTIFGALLIEGVLRAIPKKGA
ncbi:hypothetical protein ACFLRA_01540 [Bdellovibrionota bacterium]